MTVQTKFIDRLIEEEREVSVYVDSGIRQVGVILEHDDDAILLEGEKSIQIIYKRKASTVCLHEGNM